MEKSIANLTEKQIETFLKAQRICDNVLRDFEVEQIDEDGLLTELSRISASVEQIWQDYYEWVKT